MCTYLCRYVHLVICGVLSPIGMCEGLLEQVSPGILVLDRNQNKTQTLNPKLEVGANLDPSQNKLITLLSVDK